MSRPKIVIVGGGFGGIAIAKALKNAPVDVLLIDKTNHHLFQPLLYQVATAVLSPADIAAPIRQMLTHQSNATVIMGCVVSIEREKKQLTLLEGEVIQYDYLVLAIGARHSYFGNDAWEKYAPGLKTLEDALVIREKVLIAYEQAERCLDPAQAAAFLRFAVIGGGPTGVEMAGAIAEIAHQSMPKDFRRIKPSNSQIFLIEGTNQILNGYPLALAQKAQKALEDLGVHVLTNKMVSNVTAEGLYFQNEFLPVPNIIWAAGNQVSPLLKSLAVPLDRQGRVIVQSDLSLPGDPHVFVIGDAAHFKDPKGLPLPGIAPAAVQQGRYLGKMIAAEIANEKQPGKGNDQRKPFVYFDKGSMATIGRSKAVAMVGKLQFSGFIAWLTWSFIHIYYLIDFKNRLMVMLEWSFWYFTGLRNVRLIEHSIDEVTPLKK